MERRRLGNTDLVVSVLGFGGSEIGYQGATGATVARLLTGALDAGLNVIDTAECYDDSEILIGKAVGGRRREFYLFTKCGHGAGWRANWRPKALGKSIERSLERLGTDHLDLIQLHSCSLAELRRATSSTRSSRHASGVSRATSAIAATARPRALPSSAAGSTHSRPPSASQTRRRSS
jgi:aryl-alcohol dehydrogenase-like predicted oxidoreductase